MALRALVSLSGGIDSATALAVAVKNRGNKNVKAVGFSYGSKHNPFEIACARKLADHYEVPYITLQAQSIFSNFKSALMQEDVPIPEGHYEAESMKLTVVPNRNLIFLSILAGIAVSEGMDEIWLGVHAGDHHIYSDCRPEFIASAQATLRLATDTNLALNCPFLFRKKKDILKIGYQYEVPYQFTRTCYSADPVACGRCGSCSERLESFRDIGMEDPLKYQSREILPK